MSNSNPVPRIYRAVIDDVIKNVKEAFLNEGVDDQVLQELKQLWESKLLQSRAIDFMPSDVNVRVSLTYPHNVPQQMQGINHDQQQAGSSQQRITPPANSAQFNPNTTQGQQVVYVSSSHHPTLGNVGPMSGAAAQAAMALQNSGQTAGTIINTHQLAGIPQTQVIRVQQGPPGQQAQMFPAFQQTRGAVNAPRIIYAQPPPRPQGGAGQKKPVIQVDGSSDLLETNIRESPLLDDKIDKHDDLCSNKTCTSDIPDDALGVCICGTDNTNLCTCNKNKQTVSDCSTTTKRRSRKPSKKEIVLQLGGDTDESDEEDMPSLPSNSKSPLEVVLQVDGANDSSSDEFDDDEDFDNYPVTAIGGAQGGSGEAGEEVTEEEEEEPLNSEDDVSDEDPVDLFDTDNVVVCQYDKIARVRNRWKFHLKDGIMNLRSKDYVFHKANGDSEW